MKNSGNKCPQQWNFMLFKAETYVFEYADYESPISNLEYFE